MKKFLFSWMTVAAAATLILSCNKENSGPEVLHKVPAVIAASVDEALSKTVLGTDGLTVSWDGTESVAVFDGISATPNKFDAASAGATTSFSGEVTEGATNFILVYPYQADAVVDYDANPQTVLVDIPAVQYAVKDGFDPRAAFAVGEAASLDEAVSMRNLFALLKVEVDVDGVTGITVSATNRKIAGSTSLRIGSNGSANGTGTTSNSVLLKNEDDSPLAQGFYYIAVRPSSETSPYQGFQMTVNKGSKSGTRSASNNLIIARNTVLSIGKVSAISFETSRYASYMAGEDITVGSLTLNKNTHGDAVLLTADNAVTALNKTSLEAGGVFFLKTVGTGSFSNANNPTITKGTYLLSDSEERIPVAMTNTFNLADNGVLGLQGLALSISGKDYFFAVNKNTSASMDSFVMDDCAVNMSCKSMIATNSSYKAYGVKHIAITRSDFKVSVATNLVTLSSDATGITAYETFLFNHNTVYSSTGSNILTTIFNYTGTTGDQMAATVSNNLFYNVVNGGTFKHNTLASATATKNVFWAVDGTDPGANAKLWGMKTKAAIPTVNVTDNVAYGTLAEGRKWVIADSTINTGMDALTELEINPIATADVANGVFTMASGYESYGPQL